MINKFTPYEGSLGVSVGMPLEARRAYLIYRTQINKCRNHKVREFQWYGARGIEVKYSVRDFIGWWLLHISAKKWKRPTTGRIDHEGHYCFENIEMQELADNVKESHVRIGDKRFNCHRKKVLVDEAGKQSLFFSAKEAADYLKIGASNVTRFCTGEMKPRRKDLTMRYVNDI